MLKDILSVSGKPGLYRLLKTGKTNFVVESLSDNRRMPIHASERVVSLREISIYSKSEDIPLGDVLDAIYALEKGKEIDLNTFSNNNNLYFDYFEKVLPEYDRDMVHDNEIKKILKWYNLLLKNGFKEFKNKKDDVETPSEEKPNINKGNDLEK